MAESSFVLTRDQWRAAANFIILATAVWAVYGCAIYSPFIYDDVPSIVENPSIERLWPLVGDAQQPGPLNPWPDRATCGRPLANLTLAVNYHFGKLDPVGYHVVNLVLHALSAALLAAIVGRTLHLDYFQGRFDRVAWPLSLGVGLLWAVHPLNTEAVNYITQRTELLMGFCYLATLYASLRYWTTTSTLARITWLVLATLVCLAGMASKEVMVTAPLTVLLYERAFLTGSFGQALRRSWPLYAGLALGWVLLLSLNANSPRGDVAGFHRLAPRFWWLTQTKVLFTYLKLAVWPWPLMIHYSMPLVSSLSAAWPWLVAAALLAVATLVLLARNSPFGFLAAVIWLILSPTLVVPIVTEVAAERRMYLPLAALVALVVVGGYAALERKSASTGKWPLTLGAAILIAAVLGLSLLGLHRLSYYNDELSLWRDAQLYQPDDPYVSCAVGYFLNQAGRPAEAQEQYERVLRLHPNYTPAHTGLGTSLIQLGRPQAAIEPFRKAVELAPGSPTVHYDLGHALAQSGQTDEAIEQLEQGLGATSKLPDVQNELGKQLLKVDRGQEAANHLQIAVAAKPDFAEAWFNLAQANAQRSSSNDAVAAAEKALELARSQEKMELARKIEAWLSTHRAESTKVSPASPPPEQAP